MSTHCHHVFLMFSGPNVIIEPRVPAAGHSSRSNDLFGVLYFLF